MKKQFYVRLEFKKENVDTFFKLPVTIGGNELCDLVVDELSDNEYLVLMERQGQLYLIDGRKKKRIALSTLMRLGIIHHDPSESSKLEKISWKSKVRSTVSRWFPRSRKRRLVYSILFFFALTGVGLRLAKNEVEDLSKTIIPLPVGKIVTEAYGHTAIRKGREKGFIFGFNHNGKNVPYLLRMNAGSLDLDGEISIGINQKKVYEYNVDIKCDESFCPLEINIDPQFLVQGQNNIVIVHKNAQSHYILKDFVLTKRIFLSENEKEEVMKSLDIGQRYFNEREISPENIKLARNESRKLSDWKNRRVIPYDLKFDINLFSKEIDEEYAKYTKELERDAMNYVKLRKFDEAKEKLELLLSLCLDDDYRKRNQLMAQINTLKKLLEEG